MSDAAPADAAPAAAAEAPAAAPAARSADGISDSTRALIERYQQNFTADPEAAAPAPEPAAEAKPAEPPPAVVAPVEPPPAVEDERDKRIASYDQRREQFYEEPVKAVRQQLADWLGIDPTSPDMQRHLVELVTDISGEIAGSPVTKVSAEKVERRLSRKLEQFKQQTHAAEEKRTREASDAERVQNRSSTVQYLDGQLKSANAQYPALAAMDAPGAAILDRIEAAARRGERLEWNKAASDAEVELTQFLNRFQPLFATKQQATPAVPVVESKQSSPSSSHRAPAIRNADASSVSPTPREPAKSLAEAERQTIERIRARMNER